MALSGQLPHSAAASLLSDHGESSTSFASQSAVPSCPPRTSSGSVACVSTSHSLQKSFSRCRRRYPEHSFVGSAENGAIVAAKHGDKELGGYANPNRGMLSGAFLGKFASAIPAHDYCSGAQRPPCSTSLVRCSAADEANGEEEKDSALELPLFPLPLVLFPGAILPLQIFEFRYRIMMHTLLQTDLRFGVVYTDRTSGIAGVGCVGEVVKHERLVDDRFFMVCKGQERFRVIDIVRTKPYLVARVDWLEDRPSSVEQEDAEALADEVETYMRDVIWLSNRVNGRPEKSAPEDLRKKLFPTPFSFWVASTFEGAPVEQQALLELEDTTQRLKREKETLKNTLSYLSAASAVKDAFPSND